MQPSTEPDEPNRIAVTGEVEPFVRHIDPWISCDDCFEMIDEAVQGFIDDGSGLPHALRVHLNDCAVCLDEAESLITLLEADADRDVEVALTRFHEGLHSPTA